VERGIDPFAELKQAREEYNVYDSHYEKIGKVDDVFVDEGDRALYVGVKMGFLGTNSTLIPTEIIRVNDRRRLIEVAEPADTIKHAPHFGSNEDLSPELENHVRTYFGLEPLRTSPEHGPQGPYASDVAAERLGPDVRVDTEPGERAEEQKPYLPPPQEEIPPAREPAPEEVIGSREPLAAPPRETSSSPWERTETVSGTAVHRRKR
jgi:PRC-barrel domain